MLTFHNDPKIKAKYVEQPGDDALVFRLVFAPGTPRIDPGDKGRLAQAVLDGCYELGLLTRLS